MPESDRAPGEAEPNPGALASRPIFSAIVALWFAALFGGGALFLPQVLFDALFDALPGGSPPFGAQTRVVVALGAAGIGLLLGLFIASRVRADAKEDRVETPPRPRKKDTRPPLDVRAALGFEDDEEQLDERFEHERHTAVRPPIDDPHFASAWSDSDAYDLAEFGTESRDEPTPRSGNRASTYNPFAEFLDDDEEDEDVGEGFQGEVAGNIEEDVAAFDRAEPPEPWADRDEPEPVRHAAPPRPCASPPPPVWPQPRTEERPLNDMGVAELVERLARALQSGEAREDAAPAPPRHGQHRHESALAPRVAAQSAPAESDVDRAMRNALARLSRLDDVA